MQQQYSSLEDGGTCSIYYRPLQATDYDALKAIHAQLFPIDYEDSFFQKAVTGQDRVFSWAAVAAQHGQEQLVGFITARMVYLHECDPTDRQCMGLGSKYLDSCSLVYVLTLGVVESFRHCGIARYMLSLVQQHAAMSRCRAVFLHVISYNTPAMNLYMRAGYQAVGRLPSFYHLATGRQPDPDTQWYDAYLYVLYLNTGPEPPMPLQWAGGVWGMAVAPLRSIMGTLHDCMPPYLAPQCSRQLYVPCWLPPMAQASYGVPQPATMSPHHQSSPHPGSKHQPQYQHPHMINPAHQHHHSRPQYSVPTDERSLGEANSRDSSVTGACSMPPPLTPPAQHAPPSSLQQRHNSFSSTHNGGGGGGGDAVASGGDHRHGHRGSHHSSHRSSNGTGSCIQASGSSSHQPLQGGGGHQAQQSNHHSHHSSGHHPHSQQQQQQQEKPSLLQALLRPSSAHVHNR